jgi:hypothetical protein
VKTKPLSAHLQVSQYGDFRLTDAVRPSLDLQVIPEQGFRVDTYRDPKAGLEVPVLAASVSRELLFDAFMNLLDPLGPVVDVVLETSHASAGTNHRDLVRTHVDLPVVQSHFCEFEELILNDGCTGVAVVSTHKPIEVQFDEHKLLVVYARQLAPFVRILRLAGVDRNDQLKLITEGEHFHTTDPRFAADFKLLCSRLGVGERVGNVNW